MNFIDIKDAAQRNGAIYFVVGRGTEGGGNSYRLSVAGVTNAKWGTVSAVAAKSGYSIGSIQVDLGQRGTWALGSIEERAPKPGELTYVDAIIGQASAYARDNQLSFPTDAAGLAALRSDLLSRGNGKGGNPSIRFISTEHRDSINAWASSENGKQWIHRNIDFPQVQALADSAKQALDRYGRNIPEDRKFEVLCVLAKSANQHPRSYNKLVASLRNGADYDAFMEEVEQRKAAINSFAGDKAGVLARQYQDNFQKPGNALAMEDAHRRVASSSYLPSEERNIPSIQTALAAYRREVNDPSVLDRGDKGEDVKALQRALMREGRALKDDGGFGAGTERQLTAFQSDHHLEATGFGDRPTLRALGIAPALDARSSASLKGLVDTLQADHRFTAAQVARIAESSQNYLLEHRQALGEVTQILLSKNGDCLLFRNDFSQMRELDVQQAIQGYQPSRPLVEAPVAAHSQTNERTTEAVQR